MINGFIVIDKPAGITSSAVVMKLKKYLPKNIKIGHTGTLDPEVTGVLGVAIGKSTKSIQYLEYLNNNQKVYKTTLKFGIKTDTQDIYGNILSKEEVRDIHIDEIKEVLYKIIENYSQVPPMYSAIKFNGKKLYEYARKGIEVERTARNVEISEFREIEYDNEKKELSFIVYCSKGTYVRTLCEDIAKKLGTIATMLKLVRLKSDVFFLEDAIKLEDIDCYEKLLENIIPLNQVFNDFTKINLNIENARHVINGVKIDLSRFLSKDNQSISDLYYRVKYKNECIAIAKKNGSSIFTDIRFYTKEDLEKI